MFSNRMLAVVFAVLLSLNSASSAPKDASQDPKDLIARALQQEYLWTEATPPLFLHGEIRIGDAKGGVAKGEYTYYWVSPSRWREDIRFVNYQRVRVGDAGGYWQKSSMDYEPQPIFQLEAVLKLKDAVKLGPKQTLSKVRSHKENGKQQQCTDISWTSAADRILCFDPANGTLQNVDFVRVEGQHEREITRLEYAGFAPFAGKLVPREVRALQGKMTAASLNILELSEGPQADPALFAPPEGAVHWAWCAEAEDRELVTSSAPLYPSQAKDKLQQGRVIYYGVIEGDGTLSHLTLIQGAAPLLDAVTLQALKDWRYKPATCGEAPARTETSLAMDFFLGG